MPFLKNSASTAAKVFVIIVCLVIALLEVWSASRERDVELSQAIGATSNVVTALAQHADQTFNEVDIVLLGILERLEKDGYSAPALERTHDLMVMRVSHLPQLAGLFVYDENGQWIVNSQPMLESKYNNSDRDYFIYHRDHRLNAPFIGKPIKSKSTGQWILTISRRINKIDGTFGGVVLGTIDLSFLQRFYDKFDIGQDGALVLGTLDGTILFRRPLLADSIGKSLATSELFQNHIKKRANGSVEIHSTQDGILRIVSFQRLSDHPLFLVVGMSKEEVLASWARHVWFRAIGLSFLLIVLCYGGTKMVAQVTRREIAERAALEAKQEIESLYQSLEEQSQKDGLTGVFNRRYFDNALSCEIARLKRTSGEVSLLMIDVDCFKQFNDAYGHANGDTCLQKVARSIQRGAQRQCDVVARYGGEEFAVILPECGQKGALAVARSILSHLRDETLAHARSPKGIVTASIGVTTLRAEFSSGITPRQFVECADEALYLAKEFGRDQVIFQELTAQIEIEGLITHADPG